MSVLNKKVSCFPGISYTTQGIDVNLLDLLQTQKYKARITELCSQTDNSAQKRLKEQLPCYTVAGTFSKRESKGLVSLSGLAGVDLDSAENYDTYYLLKELKKIDCIAYAGLSCRGQRLFCIVPFLYPDKYVKHYERLTQSFIDMGLPMGDTCHKTISQPRYVSWNDESSQFFKHNAKPYSLLPIERSHHYMKKPHKTRQFTNASFQWCMEQINKSYSFNEGQRHDYVLHLARYCNLKGLSEEETLSGCRLLVQEDFPEAEIKNIIQHVYIRQADSFGKLGAE